MKERTMQQALMDALVADPRWPAGAKVLVNQNFSDLTQALAKTRFLVVVEEPDDLEGLYGATNFNERSTWTLSVFTSETFNKTGLDNLSAAVLVRTILAETNPCDLWAEPLSRCRIRFVGIADNIVARDVTFTAAYQS